MSEQTQTTSTIEKVKISVLSKGAPQSYMIRKGLGLTALKSKCKDLEFDCHKGDCGICIFKVKEGSENLSPPKNVEEDFLKAMRADDDERLACQCRVFGPLTIELEDYEPN